jgi:hypothetical protein
MDVNNPSVVGYMLVPRDAKPTMEFIGITPGSFRTNKKRTEFWEWGMKEEPNALVWTRWKGIPKTTGATKTGPKEAGLLSAWWTTAREYIQKLDVVMYYK